MLIIRNTYPDRDILVTLRDVATGQDGETLTLEIGDYPKAVEVDGEHQVVLSTRARHPGEAPILGATLLHDVEPDVVMEVAKDAEAAEVAKDKRKAKTAA